MSCQVKTRPGMSREMHIADVLGAVEHAAQINTAWTIARFKRGLIEKDDTPCCAGCAGAQFVDPGKSRAPEVTTMDIVCRTKRADCKAAAAMSIGYERAVAIFRDNMNPIEARSRWYAVYESGDDPDYGHVVVMTPEGRDDPTAEMIEENGRAS